MRQRQPDAGARCVMRFLASIGQKPHHMRITPTGPAGSLMLIRIPLSYGLAETKTQEQCYEKSKSADRGPEPRSGEY